MKPVVIPAANFNNSIRTTENQRGGVMSLLHSRCTVLALLALSCLFFWSAVTAADSGQQLVGDIERAIKARDVAALLDRADLSHALASNVSFLIGLIDDCNEGIACSVTVKPLDDAWREKDASIRERQKTEWRVAPEGILRIAGKRDAKAGDSSGGPRSMAMELPYARIGGQTRIVVAALQPAERARLMATSANAAADATLAQSSSFANLDISGTEWKAKAKALPSGGGKPGAAYLAYVGKVADAIKAKDVDALTVATGELGQVLFGSKDYAGKAVPLDKRQRKMRAQSMRMVVEAKVLGGYLLDGNALLIIEGRNGFGNAVRGAMLMELQNGVWIQSGADLLVIPAG